MNGKPISPTLSKKNVGFKITPMGSSQISKAFELYQQEHPDHDIQFFIQLYGAVSPYKQQHALTTGILLRDVVLAEDQHQDVYGLYVYEAKPKQSFIVKDIIVREKEDSKELFLLFVRHITMNALTLQTKQIIFENKLHRSHEDYIIKNSGGLPTTMGNYKIDLAKGLYV